MMLDATLIDSRKNEFECVAFADDITLISTECVDIGKVKEIYVRFVLEVNLDKCESTSNKENVEFLGQELDTTAKFVAWKCQNATTRAHNAF